MITPKQEKFVEEYLIDLNPIAAAIRAGYSPKSAKFQSCKLLSDSNVSQLLKQKQLIIAKKYDITRDDLIKECYDLIESCKKEGFDGKGTVKDRVNWNTAIKTLARLTGLDVQKTEIKIDGPIKLTFGGSFVPGDEVDEDETTEE